MDTNIPAIPLTAKQQRFCSEYAVDANGTQAAIRAGYSKKSARSTSAKLLSKPAIKAMVEGLQQAIAGKLQINAEMVVQELAQLAFSNLHEFLQSGMQVKDLATLDPGKLKTISSIKITETQWEGGHKTSAHIMLHNKLVALKELGRHLGIFEKDNMQKLVESPTILYPGSDDN